MENDKENLQNGSAQPAAGTSVPKGQPQGERNEVKEGNSAQQRPEFGADGGVNTSTREDQLPSLNDGASPGADAKKEEETDSDELAQQQKGSDADVDQGGEPSI